LPHENFLLVLTWCGGVPRVYCPPVLHEVTGKGVGIHINVVVARHLDGELFASRLRSSIRPGVIAPAEGLGDTRGQLHRVHHWKRQRGGEKVGRGPRRGRRISTNQPHNCRAGQYLARDRSGHKSEYTLTLTVVQRDGGLSDISLASFLFLSAEA